LLNPLSQVGFGGIISGVRGSGAGKIMLYSPQCHFLFLCA
jgi:hypothetical protein